MRFGKNKTQIAGIALIAAITLPTSSFAQGTGEMSSAADPSACDREMIAHDEARGHMHSALSRYYDTLARQLYPEEYNELINKLGPEFRRSMGVADFTPPLIQHSRPFFRKYNQIFNAGEDAGVVSSLIQEGVPFIAIKVPVGLTLAILSIPHLAIQGGAPQSKSELNERISAEKEAIYKKAEERLNFLLHSLDIPQRINLRPGMSPQEIERIFISRRGHMKLAQENTDSAERIYLSNALNQLTAGLHTYLKKDQMLEECFNKNNRNSRIVIVESNPELGPAVHSVLREGKSPFSFNSPRTVSDVEAAEVTDQAKKGTYRLLQIRTHDQDVMVGGPGR